MYAELCPHLQFETVKEDATVIMSTGGISGEREYIGFIVLENLHFTQPDIQHTCNSIQLTPDDSDQGQHVF